jgi:CRP-like cAMP-binding protein
LAAFTITNYSHPTDFFENTVTLFLEIEVPPERALRVLLAAAIDATGKIGGRKPPPPSCAVKSISAEGVEYAIYVYSDFLARFRARNLTYQSILAHLKAAGLKQAILKREILDERAHEYKNFQLPDKAHLAYLFGNTKLFQDLQADDLELLVAKTELITFPAGSQIAQAGEVASVMYLLVEGMLTAEIKSKKIGGNQQIESIKPGALIGGNALLSSDTYESTVVCTSPALVCSVTLQGLEPLLGKNPELANVLSQRVAEQLIVKQFAHDKHEQGSSTQENLAAEVLSSMKRCFPSLRI